MKLTLPQKNSGGDSIQIIAILTASIAAFTDGVLFSWPSPSIPRLISNEFPEEITLEQASYITVLPPITAAIFSPIFSYVIDRIGRKKVVLSIAVPHFFGFIFIIFSNRLYLLYLSRLICGLGNAILFTAIPPYIGEIATPEIRGSWGNAMAVAIYLGIVSVNIVGGYLDIRTAGYVLIPMPVIFFVLFAFMPESPYYLLMKNEEEAARTSLQILRQSSNVEKEFKKLTLDVQRQNSEPGKWTDLFKNKANLKGLLACIFTRGAQQFSGMSAFNVYTQYLFQQSGGELSSTVSSIIFTSVVACMTAIASPILDKLGRKYAMLISSGGCAIVLASEAVYFYLKENNLVDVTDVRWYPLAGMIMYVVVFSIGMGLVPTLILSEMFSTSVKGKGLCLTNIFFQIFVMIGTKIFQVLSSNFGFYSPFLLFSVCCVFSTFLTFYLVPETKGKTLEEIQMSVKK